VDGVRTRLLLVAGLCLALLAPAPALAEPSPTRPAAAFGWPLAGPPPVTRAFEPPARPFGPGHRGVDLAATPGASVLAAGDGVVAFAGMVAGRPVVSVDHPGGLRTTYEPVAPSVGAGQAVARGSAIGTLLAGHPGCPAAACLHWGVRRGETYLDPLALLRAVRIRLLPWRDENDERRGRRITVLGCRGTRSHCESAGSAS
jgi:murein DD-endopeptidase MepM/ murein hydrolase activator NlpD